MNGQIGTNPDTRSGATRRRTPDAITIGRFIDALAAVAGNGHFLPDLDAAADLIAALVGDLGEIWAAPDVATAMPVLLAALEARGIAFRTPSSPADVRDQPFGLSVAVRAMAETGSVMLVERELADRSVSLMTETHIVVCPLERLVPTLDDVVPLLASAGSSDGSYVTIVTGPSRTADIERQLTVGVQGPSRVHVILIENLP